ncbi:phage adaptor protein [Neorhizobium sp. DT-125]|uniref:phage adaptor protein n=1 Tax=Neorhizobium sp. DT-125 TaxID=3396163 RepID=UPI003F1C6253
MTILSVFQQVAPVIGLRIPTAVMASTERAHIELAALANEMAERIAFDMNYDWSMLKKLATLTGDGVVEGFDLPEDYRRMLKKAKLWPSSSPYATLTHYPDTDQWLGLQVQNFQQIVGGWTILGNQILIRPVVNNAATVKFFYLRNTIVKAADGSLKTGFTADEDTYLLDERLLKLGIIWQWKANKGQQYAEDLSNFEDALAERIGADKGSNSIAVGRSRVGAEAIAYPWVITP